MTRQIRAHLVDPATDRVFVANVGRYLERIIIDAFDDSGSDDACCRYVLHWPAKHNETVHYDAETAEFRDPCMLKFQKGPLAEAGANGITNEALLAVVIDRLRKFQDGPFKCRENALALTNIEQALLWLHHRTRERLARNVEGTSKA